MEDLQIIIDRLIEEHGKEKVQAATESSTATDPVPPDPTHKPPTP